MKQIGQYTYDEKRCLGEGAYGKVFLGTCTKTTETVAIKKLDLVLFERDSYLRNQIVSEIEILKKFNHINIVKFIDLVTTQRSLYIITEYCKDGDLKQYISKKRLNETQALEIMIQIVNGFKQLVNIGIIHRDLKPANILNHDGIVKIADFGFAKYVDNYSSQLLRSCVGSPLYMAPQVLGRKQYTTKCDIWSIGVIYYEMLFHDVPWKGRDEQDLLKNITVKPLAFKQNVTYSPFSEHFLKGALANDEAARFTWEEVFTMFQAQEKQLQQISPLLQRINFENGLLPEEEEEVQKVPTWMANKAKVQPVGPEQLTKNLKSIQSQRQELAFRHFICVEMKAKQDTLKSMIKKELVFEELLGIMARQVYMSAKFLLQNLVEVCDAGEAHLPKGMKSQMVETFKKEFTFYETFFYDLKDEFDRFDFTPRLMTIEKLRESFENESPEVLKQLEDYTNSRATLLTNDLIQDLKNSKDQNAFGISVLCEYLVDSVIARRRVAQAIEVDYDLIHLEKTNDDMRQSLERIQMKIKST